METRFDIPLMVKVANMYHQEGLKQDEIAAKLQISRAMISMILAEAKEVGIVEINIRDPLVNNDELSDKFKNLFNLKDCIVIPTSIQDSNTVRNIIAQRAIDVFNKELDNYQTVGITWGRTCYQFISSVNLDKNVKDVAVIPLIGGSNQTAKYFQINEMVRKLAEKINGMPYFIYAPALAASPKETEIYMTSSAMQNILEKWRKIDIVITGIGTVDNLDRNEREIYTGEDEVYNSPEGNKAVGDICARYFDINGEFIKNTFSDRVIGISVEDMKNSKTVIGIASGMHKTLSILGALRTQVLDIFITDEQTAAAVLKNI